MPYKSRKTNLKELSKKLGKELDRRVKFSKEVKAEIKALHVAGASMRGLARDFQASRKMVAFICFPERYERHKQKDREEQHWKKYLESKKERRETMKSYRDHRQKWFMEAEKLKTKE